MRSLAKDDRGIFRKNINRAAKRLLERTFSENSMMKHFGYGKP